MSESGAPTLCEQRRPGRIMQSKCTRLCCDQLLEVVLRGCSCEWLAGAQGATSSPADSLALDADLLAEAVVADHLNHCVDASSSRGSR